MNWNLLTCLTKQLFCPSNALSMKRALQQDSSSSSTKKARPTNVIGVLALQGAFKEHCIMLKSSSSSIETREVRTIQDFDNLIGLVIPGGESTAIAKIATRFGTAKKGGQDDMFGALRKWIQIEQRPVWGTCAGLIFMAENIIDGAKIGGQPLIGGLNVDVSRNYFGKQIKSFEAEIQPPPLKKVKGEEEEDEEEDTYTGIFIRAPAILRVGKDVVTLASVMSESGEEVAVAVEQGQLLATAFHPELTEDTRWHEYFVKKCLLKGKD